MDTSFQNYFTTIIDNFTNHPFNFYIIEAKDR